MVLITVGTLQASAQLSITPNQTASNLANLLVATSGTAGVTVTNASLTCDTAANGEFSGSSNLGISNGIALGSGDVLTAVGGSTFGLDGLPSDMASTALMSAGDADLGALVTMPTYDACVLEFDLQPVGNFIEFEYVFGSEEYPEYNCTSFNDIFAFFISGPGFSAPTNIAIIPGTTTPVSINSINDGTGICGGNTSLYVNNTGSTCTMDGFTTPMIATATVTPGQTYHLKMAIADVSDAIFNSYVILKANSLKSGSTGSSNVSSTLKDAGITIYPTEVDQYLMINQKGLDSWVVKVINTSGEICLRAELNEHSSQSLNVASLSKGMYMLHLSRKSDGHTMTERFIKQ